MFDDGDEAVWAAIEEQIEEEEADRLGALAAECQEIHESIVKMLIRSLGEEEALQNTQMQEMDRILLCFYEKKARECLTGGRSHARVAA